MELATKSSERRHHQDFQGQHLNLSVVKISLDKLEEMVSNLELNLEQARQFVGHEQEELAEQLKMITELEEKLYSASKRERQLFLQKLIEEKERKKLLEITLKGQLYNLQKREVIYTQYKELLQEKKQSLKYKASKLSIDSDNSYLSSKKTPEKIFNPMINNNNPKLETNLTNTIILDREDKKESNSNKPPQKKGNGFLLGIIIGISLTSIGLRIFNSFQPKTASVTAPEIQQEKISTQAITVAEVSPTQIKNTLEATGTVAAYELTPVMAQPTGLQIGTSTSLCGTSRSKTG